MLPVIIAAAGLVIGVVIFCFGYARVSLRWQERQEKQEELLRLLPPLAQRIHEEAAEKRRAGCGLGFFRFVLLLAAVVGVIWAVEWLALGLPKKQAADEALRLAWPAFWAVLGLWCLRTTIVDWLSCRDCGRMLLELPRTNEERHAARLGLAMLAMLVPFAWNEYSDGRVEAAVAVVFSAVCSGLQYGMAYRRGTTFTENGLMAGGRFHPWASVTEWEWHVDRTCLAVGVRTKKGLQCVPAWFDDLDQVDDVERLLVASTGISGGTEITMPAD